MKGLGTNESLRSSLIAVTPRITLRLGMAGVGFNRSPKISQNFYCQLRPRLKVELFMRRTKLSELSSWKVRRLELSSSEGVWIIQHVSIQTVKDSGNSTFLQKGHWTLLVENSRKTSFLHSFFVIIITFIYTAQIQLYSFQMRLKCALKI